MSDQTIQQSVPPEVGELWAQLHTEARENCIALKPQINRRVLFIVIAVSILMMAAVLFSANEFWFKPQEVSRIATATARSLALDDSSRANATAMAATATAEAMLGQSALAGTATAQAATATMEAQQGAANLDATATALAEINMATAEANRCRDITLYTLEIAEMPALSPQVGATWVTDRAWPAVHADWTVTNTGACAWESVQLKTLAGETLAVKLFRDGEELSSLDSGISATVRLDFPRQAAPAQGEWILVVNDLTLFDLSHLRLDLGEQQWIVEVTPIPTPTPTPTATPTITPTPACTTVCDKCEECKQDEFGNTICKQVDCNCREECH